jgi:hypothetical protein
VAQGLLPLPPAAAAAAAAAADDDDGDGGGDDRASGRSGIVCGCDMIEKTPDMRIVLPRGTATARPPVILTALRTELLGLGLIIGEAAFDEALGDVAVHLERGEEHEHHDEGANHIRIARRGRCAPRSPSVAAPTRSAPNRSDAKAAACATGWLPHLG